MKKQQLAQELQDRIDFMLHQELIQIRLFFGLVDRLMKLVQFLQYKQELVLLFFR